MHELEKKVGLGDKNRSLELTESIRLEWQSIVDLLAEIAGVKAALIKRLNYNGLENIIVNTGGDEYYQAGSIVQPINNNVYCQKVIEEDAAVEIVDANQDEIWRYSSGAKKGLTNYYGLPIHNPEGQIYGTVCVLDDKSKPISPEVKEFIAKTAKMIEGNLGILKMGITDGLTGVYNRRSMDETMEILTSNLMPADIMLIDVDHFKEFNDHYGHLTGDKILKEVVAAMKDCLPQESLIFRYGGDEFFVICLPTSREIKAQAAKNLINQVHEIKAPRQLTLSVGIAEISECRDAKKVFAQVDEALYRAKNKARNTYSF